MKQILPVISLFTLILVTGCRDAAGPSGEQNPGGDAIIWFNGLSATADAWFIHSDSLVHSAWLTGTAPNQIRDITGECFGVLSSLSAELRVIDPLETSQFHSVVMFPQGSNPYCFTAESDGSEGYATLLLKDSIAVFDPMAGEIIGYFETRANPSGISLSGQKLFVGYGNWPDAASPGGVSVYQLNGNEERWLDTGLNTYMLKKQPTGSVHCYSSTYDDDGVISILTADGTSIQTQIVCGGAPGAAVKRGDSFISPDGWGRGGLIVYQESGAFSRVDTFFPPTCLAIYGDSLYATSFPRDMIYILNPDSYQVIDSLPSGGQGPQGIIAVSPSS